MDRVGNQTAAGATLHLTPEPVWRAQAHQATYEPEAFASEGFVHCTDGDELLIEVANRYYRADPRAHLVLDIDLARAQAPAYYEDDARRFPHVFGPIAREAVTRVRRVERAADGTFTAIGDTVT
jgi:uncharacterized protein (DUF952 family)